MSNNNTNFINIKGLNISYNIYGNGAINVLLLHGWGANKDLFKPVTDILSKENELKLISLDFPGFGKSDLPPEPWDTKDYTDFTLDFAKKLNLNKFVLIGHSFGGRISIRIASQKPELIDKVILVDSAGIKPKRKLKYYIKVWTFKLSKKLLKLFYRGKNFDEKMKTLYKKYGSEDYKNTEGVMRQSLVKVVNEDLSDLLPKIEAPTLIMWGENDEETPIWMGQKIEKVMNEAGKDAALIGLKNAGHYSFLDKLNEFVVIIKKFIIG